MSDRLLAVTLALCLALPLCISLDGDLFATREKTRLSAPIQITQIEGQPRGLSSIETVNQEEREAARRFAILAVEAMERQAGAVEGSFFRHDSHWADTDLPVIIPQPGSR